MGYDFLGLSILAFSAYILGTSLALLINVCSLVIAYVFTGIALSTLARNNGYHDKAMLAWIPIANLYLLVLIAGDSEIFSINIKAQYLAIALVLLRLFGGFKSSHFSIWLISMITLLYAYYILFKKISGKNTAILLSILSLIPLFNGIILYMNKNARITDYDYEIL